MTATKCDAIIIGGGILGLATAAELARTNPRLRLRILEKEDDWAQHQTGRNSGVIHSGIYYKPGSLKARFAREGSRSMVEFCRANGVPVEVCGKVIVATRDEELPRLEALFQRGLENGLEVRKLDAAEVREHEPHVQAVAGIFVPSTGITDYAQVCRVLARQVADAGHDLHLSTEVTGFESRPGGRIVKTSRGDFETGFVINCAGLQSDRLARAAGAPAEARIVPFRGEYFELVPARRHLVRNLIYPVPNPDFPFLGVHFTRMVDGSVHAGPNAVLSLKREGYRKSDVSLLDLADTLSYPGFWRLAARNAREGAAEIYRSLSKPAFVRSLQQLIPEVTADDVVPSDAGVRAQALDPSGALVDDFLITQGERALHVLNAPSPAATSSLEIAKHIVKILPAELQPSAAATAR